MPRQTEHLPLLSVSPGTKRELVVHRYGKPGQGRKVHMQASLHADEWPGMMAIHHLIPLLDKADADGKILGELVIVPYANPIGMSQRVGGRVDGRYAFDGTGNFNRDWVDFAELAAPKLEGKLSGDVEGDVALVRACFRGIIDELPQHTENTFWRARLLELSYDADYILDLHCDGEASVHLYANERQRETAKNAAYDLDSPVLMLEPSVGGGSFEEIVCAAWWKLSEGYDWASHLPNVCFGTTVELRGRQDISDEFGKKDAAGLMSFLAREGIIAGAVTPQRSEVLATSLTAIDVLNAPCAGLVSFPLALEAAVKSGDVIAYVIDPAATDPAKARHEIRTQTDGLFFARNDQNLVDPGDGVAKVAGVRPLDYRKAGNLLEA